MSAKAHQLQALFARRREMEHMRMQRTEAVNQYYDHWDKVNTRFANWTTPKYYKEAEEKLNAKKNKKEAEKKLQERQNKLRAILAAEKSLYEEETRLRSKQRSRKIPASSETLKKIDDNLKERENIKRKLEMEAKLYGRWRHGVNDEHKIFESKSDNEVLAKLNWLDKQIDEQLQREKEEAIAQERNLRMQEEISKMEQVQKERQLIREKEISEIRSLQERHMTELKERESETDMLKSQEKQLRTFLDDLEKEIELLEESSLLIVDPANNPQSHNLKKIKVFMRQRSDVFRNQIKIALDILKRMEKSTTRRELVHTLQNKYQDQLDLEECVLSQIEGMYESEAKYNLQRLESIWQKQHMERYQKLHEFIKEELYTVSGQLQENLQRQTDNIDVRSTHLSSIESSNDKLKQLMKEDAESPRNSASESSVLAPTPTASASASTMFQSADRMSLKSGQTIPLRGVSSKSVQSLVPKVSSSFSNLNLDVWQDLPSARGGIDSPRLQSTRSMHVVTSENAERPKYARKRVAWN